MNGDRYRAEVASGGTGADVVDTEAKPMREVIARCGTLGQARVIVVALNNTEQATQRIRQLEWALGQISVDDGGWGRIARAALRPDRAIPGDVA